MCPEQHIDDQDFICPHCKEKVSDSWEFIATGDTYIGKYDVVECPHCEVEFEGMVEIGYTYYSQVKQKEKNES